MTRCTAHDDVIKWKHFPRYWPFVREFTGHRWIPAQRPVTRSCDVFFDLRMNKRLSKQSWGWWFETPSPSLWRHCNGKSMFVSAIRIVTHCNRDKMATISQTTFSTAFSSMKLFVFWLKFDRSLFLSVQLTINQHWFRQFPGAEEAASHYLNQWWPSWLTHTCVTRPHWFNTWCFAKFRVIGWCYGIIKSQRNLKKHV